MASLLQSLSILQFYFTIMCCMALADQMQPYIVYMGSSSGDGEVDDVELLSSLFPSGETEKITLLQSYNHVFKGFSALLTENQASVLSGFDEVVSVFPDPVLNLHTTRSWDFLEATDSKLSSVYPHARSSVDVIIGMVDTGIWPESPSFDDSHIAEVPPRWKGVCMEGSDFKKSNCNRKLIGARHYSNKGSPRDLVGHGTHTASTAGGTTVANASYYGLARGPARGGLPSARLAMYKACTEEGCLGSTLLKAIDDAVKDGVDIISISIGMSSIFQPDFTSDPIAIGAFHAMEKGVMVVCSAGNDGPNPYTVINTAPWIFTVGASSIDRDFQSTILLGNNKSYNGRAISFSSSKTGERYPLAFAESVAASFTPASDARNCAPGSLDATKVAGKIVVCMNDEPNVSRRIKMLVVEDAKAKGVIIVDEEGDINIAPFDSGTYPFSQVGKTVGSQILGYIKSTMNPTATILRSAEISSSKPAPVVASFSSRGPGGLTENILKPDITAPGVAILAAIVPRIRVDYNAPGNKPSMFGLRSGTSMSCPHVTGAMAFIKSTHPHWSFSIIKSALMTTASTLNNMGKPLTNTLRFPATPHEVGAGEIRPIKALDPGLAFETSAIDHLYFLCYYGLDEKVVRAMSGRNFSCPRGSTEQLVSSINYPSISVGRLGRDEGPRKVRRVATNVGSSKDATYVSSVNAPAGLTVKVVPRKIVFKEGVKTAAFKVFFDGSQASKGYNYGDIRFFDGSHIVRVVFAVNVE